MELIGLIPILIYMIGVPILIFKLANAIQTKSRNRKRTQPIQTQEIIENLKMFDGAYKKSWLFSYNEKEAYKKIKEIANQHNLSLFAKVRLLDLLEPVRGTSKYQTFFNKIQSKHVDFVLCDEKLVAKYIIELDDSSHDNKERQERDNFVDYIVKSVGYKILHIRAVNKEEIETFLRS